MWMMGCHDDPDSFNCARKLRPLIPRPAAPPPPSITRIHAPDHFFLAAMAEQNKRDGASSVVVSSRWNPTPEQLRTLEELYRRGTRTPSADQIQHITAQLRRYGKIEGKNVFYWFQNHKARERQKRRRQMECPQDIDQKDKSSSSSSPGGGSSTRVASLEAEQNKNTNTNTTPPDQPEEEQIRGTRAGTAMAEACTTMRDGWVQYDHRELQQQQIIMTRNATWRSMMQLPCPLPPPAARVTPTPTVTLPSKRLNVKDQDYLNIFFSSTHHHNTVDFADDNHDHGHDHHHTLELFPLCSENSGHDHNKLTTPNYQFFEFLPLKNKN